MRVAIIECLIADPLGGLAQCQLPQCQEIPLAEKVLDRAMGLIGQMQEVDTAGIEPMSHPLEVTQRLREDRVSETDRHELYQSVAPAVERGLYLVPKVIE